MDLPSELARHVNDTFGAAGVAWLRELPRLVEFAAQRWMLVIAPAFDLSSSYVAPAHRADGSQVVLKIAFPNDEARRQMSALRLYGGRGACELLDADEGHCAMLLERVTPGETLVVRAGEDDEGATRIGAAVMRALWRPPPQRSSFQPLAEWFEAFARHRERYAEASPLPAPLLHRAQTLAHELLASTEDVVLLHGDLHHYNILSAKRSPWLAIDPKGVVGDRGYEVGPFLLNPLGDDRAPEAARLSRRLDVLADELEYDRERLLKWGVAHAMLSACWSVEDHEAGWERAVATAEVLLTL